MNDTTKIIYKLLDGHLKDQAISTKERTAIESLLAVWREQGVKRQKVVMKVSTQNLITDIRPIGTVIKRLNGPEWLECDNQRLIKRFAIQPISVKQMFAKATPAKMRLRKP